MAGKRAGMKHEDHGDEETTRSGLFMDQIRLVKEMREHDRSIGRAGVDVRPRWMVWENVPGAFSSNHGKDFQAVLEEIIKVAEPSAPGVPLPEEGRWSKSGCIYDELGKWSVAWRVHDAQYHGVAQRRKRIGLLADFGGLAAPWIMFEPQLEREAPGGGSDETEPHPGTESRSEVQPVGEGVSGNTEPGGEAGKKTAGGAGAGAESAGRCLNPWDIQSKHIQSEDGVAETLYSGEARYGGGEAYVMQEKPDTICLEGNGSRASHFGNGYSESDVMYTLNTIEQHGVLPVAASGIVSKGNGEAWLMDEKTTSVTSGGGQAGQGYPAALVHNEPIVLESNQNHATVTDDGISPTLPASMGMGGGYVPMVTDSWTIDEKIGQTYVHHDSANTLAARDYKQPQAVLPETHSISFQERAGKPGGGKGILIQDEHTGALSTLNIQHVFSIQGNAIDRDAKMNGSGVCEDVAHTLNSTDRHGVCPVEPNVLALETYHCESSEDTAMTLKARDYKDPQSVYCVQPGPEVKVYAFDSLASNSMKSSNPNSGCHETEVSKCLDCASVDPSKNQGGIAIVQPTMILNDQGGQQMDVSYDVTSTLRAQDHGHPPLVFSAGFDGNMGSKAHGIGYEEEKAPTLNAGKTMSVVASAGFSFGQSANAHSLGYQEECSPTLRGGQGGNQKPVVLEMREAVPIENHPNDSRAKICEDGVVQTLSGRMGTGGNNTPLIMERRFSDVRISEDDVSPTLESGTGEGGNNLPMVLNAIPFDTTQITSPDNWSTPKPGDPCHPLASTAHPPAVAFTQNQREEVRDLEDVATAIQAESGTHQQTYVATCIGNGQADIASHISEEVCQTLNCMHDAMAVHVGDVTAVDCRNATENADVNGTLQAKEQGQNLNSNNVCRTGNTVRRLTPLECERLQAFPDFWTQIGEWTDSKGKVHKEADTPRYKALGNSIALPFWYWLLNRISAQYDEDYTPTLGSLFDGIGGFPLCWETINGKGTALWASEIEEFPIAVTKLRFPEPEDDHPQD